MKLLLKTSLVAALTTFVVSTAHAGDHGRGVNEHQRHQRERVVDAVESGELTRSEARAISAEQRAIRAKVAEFRSDGVLARGERHELRRDLRRSGQHIYRERHDDQRRYRHHDQDNYRGC